MKIKDIDGQERHERYITTRLVDGAKIVRASNRKPRKESKYYGNEFFTWDQELNCEVKR